MVAAVLHSPHGAKGKETCSTWWAKTREILEKLPADLIFVDANGRLGKTSITDDLIGDKGFMQDEDHNGMELRTTIQEFELRAINTLHGSPNDFTWVSRNERHRLDYILASEVWGAHFYDSCVLHDFDHGLRRDGHFPVLGLLNQGHVPA